MLEGEKTWRGLFFWGGETSSGLGKKTQEEAEEGGNTTLRYRRSVNVRSWVSERREWIYLVIFLWDG